MTVITSKTHPIASIEDLFYPAQGTENAYGFEVKIKSGQHYTLNAVSFLIEDKLASFNFPIEYISIEIASSIRVGYYYVKVNTLDLNTDFDADVETERAFTQAFYPF